MPNWCKNRVVLRGPSIRLNELVKNEFDFRSIIPLPDDADADAQYERWGTKWGASDFSHARDGRDHVFEFSTPWGPPRPVIQALLCEDGIDGRSYYSTEDLHEAGLFSLNPQGQLDLLIVRSLKSDNEWFDTPEGHGFEWFREQLRDEEDMDGMGYDDDDDDDSSVEGAKVCPV